MPYQVERPFREGDRVFKSGEKIDSDTVNGWRNREKMVDQRFIRRVDENRRPQPQAQRAR